MTPKEAQGGVDHGVGGGESGVASGPFLLWPRGTGGPWHSCPSSLPLPRRGTQGQCLSMLPEYQERLSPPPTCVCDTKDN